MREILFRGKRYMDGQWVEGSLFIDEKKDKHEILIGYVNYRVGWEVDPETVGQYTGLNDKNGKKIFEGDIVLHPWNDQDKPEIFTIKFKDGQFVASPVKETEAFWDFMVGGFSKEMEVIGNIHDNPELIGGTEDGEKAD